MQQLVKSTKHAGTLADTHLGDIWVKSLYTPLGKRKHTYLEILDVPDTDLTLIHDTPEELTWILPDGRLVGSDGFVVPLNAHDFFSRYPDYVHAITYKWMSRKLYGVKFDMDTFDDVAAEFQCHLSCLPPTQKYYRPGYCVDRLSTYDPVKSHGAKKGKYFNYINEILNKRFATYVTDDRKGLIREPSAVGLGIMESSPTDDGAQEAEGQSVLLPDQGESFEAEVIKSMDAQLILGRILGVVTERERPQVKQILEAVMVYDRQIDVAQGLGIHKDEVSKVLKRVRSLVTRKGITV